MDTFFSGSSAIDKGTLKTVFCHRSVQKDIGEAFNHASEFQRFGTYGYTILAAMKVLSMDTIDNNPIDLTAIVDRHAYLETVAKKVVGLFWLNVDYTNILEGTSNLPTDNSICNCKDGDYLNNFMTYFKIVLH